MDSAGNPDGEFDLPPERPGLPPTADLLERRWGLRALTDIQIVDTGATVQRYTIADVQCIEVASRDALGVMIYAHGGGFRSGEAEMWIGFASRLAVSSGLRIILPAYRLAPENPFPNALHDLVAVYRAICSQAPSVVFVGGDSAGGGLMCSVVLNCLAHDVCRPAGAILFSPWLDLTMSGNSYDGNAATDRAFSRESAMEAAQQYLQGASSLAAYASPLFANLSGFPSVLIFVSASEVLADDTLSLIGRLARIGVPVEAHIVPDMPHVWPVLTPSSSETAAAIEAVGRFVRNATGQSRSIQSEDSL
jgi:monoterpene epsilon-lactone hydrolase